MAQPLFVQDVDIHLGKTGAWVWSYRLGNKIVNGTVWRPQSCADVLRALDEHLAERGLSRFAA